MSDIIVAKVETSCTCGLRNEEPFVVQRTTLNVGRYRWTAKRFRWLSWSREVHRPLVKTSLDIEEGKHCVRYSGGSGNQHPQVSRKANTNTVSDTMAEVACVKKQSLTAGAPTCQQQSLRTMCGGHLPIPVACLTGHLLAGGGLLSRSRLLTGVRNNP